MTTQVMDSKGVSSCQTGAQEPVSLQKIWLDVLAIIAVVAIVGVLGAVVAFVFWGIWYAIAGAIPRFYEISRIWLDVPGLAAWTIVTFFCFLYADDERDDLEEKWECDVSWRELATVSPIYVLAGIILAIDFIASLFWTFAVGSIALLLISMIYLLGLGVWRIGQLISFYFGNFLDSLMGEEESESLES